MDNWRTQLQRLPLRGRKGQAQVQFSAQPLAGLVKQLKQVLAVQKVHQLTTLLLKRNVSNTSLWTHHLHKIVHSKGILENEYLWNDQVKNQNFTSILEELMSARSYEHYSFYSSLLSWLSAQYASKSCSGTFYIKSLCVDFCVGCFYSTLCLWDSSETEYWYEQIAVKKYFQ
jgi:hypothetical protein